MRIQQIYEKGERAINEDACVLNEQAMIYAAIDGATGLNGVPGYIASGALEDVLNRATANSSIYSWIEAASAMIREKTLDYYETNLEKTTYERFSQLSKVKRSSAALIAIQFNQAFTRLQYVHAADCMLFLQYDTGDIRMVTHDLLQDLDGMAIQELVRLQDESPDAGMTMLRKQVAPILNQNRQKANMENGYSVMDGSKTALDCLEYGDLSLNRISSLLLVSDGLQIPQSLSESDPWMQTANLAFSKGINALHEEVSKREVADPDCILYPRLKTSDDKTGILISLD